MQFTSPDDRIASESPAWRAAVMEVEQARKQYAQALAAADVSEMQVDLMWLRLWRAERRRDELMKL